MIDNHGIIALFSAASTALGVLGTLVYSYFKGRASLEKQIDNRVMMILNRQDTELEAKDETIKELNGIVEDLRSRVACLESKERDRSEPEIVE